MTMQINSVPVSGNGPRDRIKPAEEVRSRWEWTEASVWTDRMLTALEQGVKGGDQPAVGARFSLMDKVYSEENLFWSWTQVAQNDGAAGVDHVSIDAFTKQLSPNLKRLTQTLRENLYQPQDVKRVWIPKPGSQEQRPLGLFHIKQGRPFATAWCRQHFAM